MASRGFFGVVIDGTEKIAYNHDCSQPHWMGIHVLAWLRRRAKANQLQGARRKAAALRLVHPDEAPMPADVARLARWTDLSVSEHCTSDWYCLLRHTQGHPGAILQAGIAIDASDVALDSVWTEWGYLVDFDTDRFEVYKGSQYQPHTKGRFASRSSQPCPTGVGDYYPCALRAWWPLTALPTNRQFIDAFERVALVSA